MIKKIKNWFNLPFFVNENFEEIDERVIALEESVEDIEGSAVETATTIAAITTTNLPVVPALADVAAVKTYLDSLVPALETRLDLSDSKINEVLTKLKASKAIATS